mmetsp:Transcript_25356/g.50511  ORF Transcript_25356/g.50511 Transcript_25356/m.50511 type:complete len:736 (+) Transcript_25356:406-2613(+)
MHTRVLRPCGLHDTLGEFSAALPQTLFQLLGKILQLCLVLFLLCLFALGNIVPHVGQFFTGFHFFVVALLEIRLLCGVLVAGLVDTLFQFRQHGGRHRHVIEPHGGFLAAAGGQLQHQLSADQRRILRRVHGHRQRHPDRRPPRVVEKQPAHGHRVLPHAGNPIAKVVPQVQQRGPVRVVLAPDVRMSGHEVVPVGPEQHARRVPVGGGVEPVAPRPALVCVGPPRRGGVVGGLAAAADRVGVAHGAVGAAREEMVAVSEEGRALHVGLGGEGVALPVLGGFGVGGVGGASAPGLVGEDLGVDAGRVGVEFRAGGRLRAGVGVDDFSRLSVDLREKDGVAAPGHPESVLCGIVAVVRIEDPGGLVVQVAQHRIEDGLVVHVPRGGLRSEQIGHFPLDPIELDPGGDPHTPGELLLAQIRPRVPAPDGPHDQPPVQVAHGPHRHAPVLVLVPLEPRVPDRIGGAAPLVEQRVADVHPVRAQKKHVAAVVVLVRPPVRHDGRVDAHDRRRRRHRRAPHAQRDGRRRTGIRVGPLHPLPLPRRLRNVRVQRPRPRHHGVLPVGLHPSQGLGEARSRVDPRVRGAVDRREQLRRAARREAEPGVVRFEARVGDGDGARRQGGGGEEQGQREEEGAAVGGGAHRGAGEERRGAGEGGSRCAPHESVSGGSENRSGKGSSRIRTENNNRSRAVRGSRRTPSGVRHPTTSSDASDSAVFDAYSSRGLHIGHTPFKGSFHVRE